MRTRSACCLEEERKEHSFSQNSLGNFPQLKLARDFPYICPLSTRKLVSLFGPKLNAISIEYRYLMKGEIKSGNISKAARLCMSWHIFSLVTYFNKSHTRKKF